MFSSGALVIFFISTFGDVGRDEIPRTIPICALPGANLGEKSPPAPLFKGVWPRVSNPIPPNP
jgi:hypothetical protein